MTDREAAAVEFLLAEGVTVRQVVPLAWVPLEHRAGVKRLLRRGVLWYAEHSREAFEFNRKALAELEEYQRALPAT
jgi:hypothetical protein